MRVARLRVVQVLAADGAEPEAVLAADDLGRQGEGERVARPGVDVELVLLEVRRAEVLAPVGLVDLPRVDAHLVVRRLEAAHAGSVEAGLEAQPSE